MKFKYQYPHIANLLTLYPTPRILLGKRLSWTEKRDGSCIVIRREEDGYIISSKNQEEASEDLVSLVHRTEEFDKVIGMLEDNPQYVIYVEACRKGRSVTGAELYDRDFIICFDIYDSQEEHFLTYTNTYQMCYHRQMPVVKLWAETRHTSMKDLLKWKKEALIYCKENSIEGMVIKAHSKKYGYIQAKVKLDIPKPVKRKISKGEPILPSIPEADILGAIDKVWQELGTEQFRNVKVSMPKVAEEVGKECKKHLYSKSNKNLFSYYQQYLERLVDVDI